MRAPRICLAAAAAFVFLTACGDDSVLDPDDTFSLAKPLQFRDGPDVSAVRRGDIDDLRSRPIRFGANDQITDVTLRKDPDGTAAVSTCKEYDDAVAAGYAPYDTFSIKMAAFVLQPCGLLKALETARVAETSYISDPRAGVGTLRLLPFPLFPRLADEVREPDATYQSKVDSGDLVVRESSLMHLRVEEDGLAQDLEEVARADFNGDGIEDIFLDEYVYATGGTFGAGNVKILTRKGPGAPFEIVEFEYGN